MGLAALIKPYGIPFKATGDYELVEPNSGSIYPPGTQRVTGWMCVICKATYSTKRGTKRRAHWEDAHLNDSTMNNLYKSVTLGLWGWGTDTLIPMREEAAKPLEDEDVLTSIRIQNLHTQMAMGHLDVSNITNRLNPWHQNTLMSQYLVGFQGERWNATMYMKEFCIIPPNSLVDHVVKALGDEAEKLFVAANIQYLRFIGGATRCASFSVYDEFRLITLVDNLMVSQVE